MEAYRVALLAHFQVVNLAALASVYLAERVCPPIYWYPLPFENHIERNRADLVTVAKLIDQDIKSYWK